MNKIAEQARLRASLEESARCGSPVDLSVADTEVEDGKVQIEQVGWVHGSHLFELQDGRVACMVDIAITNQTSRTIHVVDVELRTTWEDSFFEWLLPVEIHTHAKRDCSYSVYRFPGPGPEFACKEVINHHLLERRRLPAKLPKGGSWESEGSCHLGYITDSGRICVSRLLQPTTLNTRRHFAFGRNGFWLGRRS